MAQVSNGIVKTNSYDGRYYQLEWHLRKQQVNKSTIIWTLRAVGGNSSLYAERTVKVVIGGVTAYSKTTRIDRKAGVVASGERIVNHNSTGDAHIDISIQAAVYTTSVNCTGSGSFDLPNIAKPSTLTCDNGTLGTQHTLTVTRNSACTHTITWQCGNASGTICTKSTNTSITWTPPLSIANQCTTSIYPLITFIIETLSDDTVIGTNTLDKYFTIPASVKPSVATAVAEATAINLGVYVQGNSMLNVVVTPTLAYGSKIISYKTTIDGKTYTGQNFKTDVIKSSGSVKIATTITDARGRTATYNSTIEVLPYSPPSIKNLSVARCNSDGTSNTQGAYAKITYDYEFASVGSKNTLEVKAQYKTKTASAYTTHATDNYTSASLEGSVTEIFAASTSSQYDIQIVATDAICELFEKTSPTATASIGTISTFYSMFKQLGFAFGKVFDTSKPNSLQVGWDIYDKYDTQIRNGMAAYSSAGIDANTTLEHHILTQTNTPSNTFHHVITYFYNDKTSTSNRVQMAIPYKTPTVTFHRYYLNGVWSEWLHEGLSAYPIGSYYIANHNTSPAELFGGTWHRIEGRFLYGCAADGTPGLTGGSRTVNLKHSHYDAFGYNANSYYATNAFGSTAYPANGYAFNASGSTATNPLQLNHTSAELGDTAIMPPYVNVAIWRRTA